MKKLVYILLALVVTSSILYSCKENDVNKKEIEKDMDKAMADAVANYAKMVHQNYKDSYDAAVSMQTKINAFVASPSDATLKAAKDAWLAAREPYGLSEVYRGSNGPIDTESEDAWAINNEGQMNAWPLNEAYIDYVAEKNSFTGTYNKSIIDGDEAITKSLLATKNEGGGDDEKAVSTGWHAIEFLLWGQDNTKPADKKAGQRPVTDYTTDSKAERRKTYLKVVTELLLEDIKKLVDTWAEGGVYNKTFLALDKKKALLNMINGPQFLATSELSNERMLVPAVGTDGIAGGKGQEDEHSCFSDNTHRDVYTNAKGIVNVLKGSYGSVSGVSFVDLVKMKDEAQAKKLQASIDKMWASIKAIDEKAKAGTPFDLMIMSEDENNQGVVIKGNNELKALGDVIHESASKIGIETTTEFE